jgi:8-amino-7-oxononanoate synthase
MTAWMDEELNQKKEHHLDRHRRRLASGQGVEVRYQRADFVNFSSNDYLALANDERLSRAAARAAHRFGTGAGASPLITGWSVPLRALERELAFWESTDGALVFPSGYQCHLALVSSLATTGDAIFSDAGNHASLIDGCRLSRANVHVYRHNDLHHLAELLEKERPKSRRRLIVSDSVFSMDGDCSDVANLLDLARVHDAMLLLDEAHATGVLGAKGRGLTDHLSDSDREDERLIKIGTLSKALGSQGGFVVGSFRLIEWLVNCARGYIFSTALAPPCAAAARRAIKIAAEDATRREQVLKLAEHLRKRLREIGRDVGKSMCQIVPVIIGDAGETMELSRKLEQSRLLVPAIRPPSVPDGASRLRISLSAGHTMEDVERLVTALR